MQLRALKPQWGGITFEVVFYYFFRISIITTITGSFFIVNLNYVHSKIFSSLSKSRWNSRKEFDPRFVKICPHLGAVHKLCRFKIQDFLPLPSPPLLPFLLSRVYVINRLFVPRFILFWWQVLRYSRKLFKIICGLIYLHTCFSKLYIFF